MNYIENRYKESDEIEKYILSILHAKSPRFINKLFKQVEINLSFWENSQLPYRRKSKKIQSFRLCDIILLSYIQLEHKPLYTFLRLTVPSMVSNKLDVDEYIKRDKYKKSPNPLYEWIKTTLKKENITVPNDEQFEDYRVLLSLVATQYRFHFDYMDNPEEDYMGTSSQWHTLNDLINIGSGKGESKFDRLYAIYLKVKKKPKDLERLSSYELNEYAHWLYNNVSSRKFNDAYILLVEFAKRLKEGTFEFTASNSSSDIQKESAYNVALLIMDSVNLSKNDNSLINLVFNVFKGILQGKKVKSMVKLIILNSLSNSSRGAGSQIHRKLNASFQSIYAINEKEIKQLMQNVFKEIKNRYTKKSIYVNEENFFYVLYQYWSGDPTDLEEIKLIRNIALNGLSKSKKALLQYWGQYPFEKPWKTYSDYITRANDFSSKNGNYLQMPIVNLVKATESSNFKDIIDSPKFKFYKKILNEIKEKENLQQTEDTLKAFLVKQNLI